MHHKVTGARRSDLTRLSEDGTVQDVDKEAAGIWLDVCLPLQEAFYDFIKEIARPNWDPHATDAVWLLAACEENEKNMCWVIIHARTLLKEPRWSETDAVEVICSMF